MSQRSEFRLKVKSSKPLINVFSIHVVELDLAGAIHLQVDLH